MGTRYGAGIGGNVAGFMFCFIERFGLDHGGGEQDLDVDGREVDFVVVERRRPTLLVEVKLTAEPASRSLRYFKQRFPSSDAFQIHLRGSRESVTPERIHLWPATRFLATLV